MSKIRFIIFLLFIAFANIALHSQALKVMSLNIRYDNPKDGENCWDKRKSSMVTLIENYHPFILGIQEALFHQLQYLDNQLETYKYVGVGRDDGKEKGEFSAILYDTAVFSVELSSTFWLSENPERVSVGWDASMERICTFGLFRLKASGKKILVFNTHFDHIGETARTESARLILEKLKELNTGSFPVIITGDFNSVPQSDAIQIISSALHDAYVFSKDEVSGPKGTFNGFDPENPIDKRIDYIFTSGFEVLSFAHINEMREDNNFISDHLPVLAKLRFK